MFTGLSASELPGAGFLSPVRLRPAWASVRLPTHGQAFWSLTAMDVPVCSLF